MKNNKIKIILKNPKYEVIYYDVSTVNNDIHIDIIGPLLNSNITYNSLHKYIETIIIQMYLDNTFVQQCNLAQFIQNLKNENKTIMTSLYKYAIENKTINVDIKELFQNKLDIKYIETISKYSEHP